MVQELKIDATLSLSLPVIDVRSPGEFQKGHIPNAINIPLFSNDERAHVGTVYKQDSRESAKVLGLKYVTPKLDGFITDSLKVAPDREVIVHCWRGGMRSHSFAQHLTENGFQQTKIILGGYKAYRNHVLDSLAAPANLFVLGGYTGSGKTYILQELEKLGEQIIDLEGLANHRGSAFGGLGQGEQPTTEQFENNLYQAWRTLDLSQPIWIEDESRNIGKANLPKPLYDQMRDAELYFIDISKVERAKHLVTEYAMCKNQLLADSIHRISKRLGGLNEKNALQYLKNENYYEVALIALQYYDKSYLKGMKRRDQDKVIHIPFSSTQHHENALALRKQFIYE